MSYQTIMSGVQDHMEEAKQYFNGRNIVGIFLQGSQNYGLSTPSSDIDTKLITTPSLHDIVMNRAAVSTTHIRENNEHIDFKDIRLMFATFRKQNLNFLEILFTDYFIVNSMYHEEWAALLEHRERIAHYNIYSAVKAMKGIALEKYHALEHLYPSRADIIAEYGYDPKQLHHLLRVEDYLARYIDGDTYQDCLHPHEGAREFLIDVKNGIYNLEQAHECAKYSLQHIEDMTAPFTKDSIYNKNDPLVDKVLDDIQEQIMTKSIRKELN